ncbi:MAG: AI-2E family transporter [bacterium]
MNQPTQLLTLRLQPKTVRTIALWSAFGLIVFWILSLLPALRSVFSIIIFALFLASILDPVVNFLENRGINRMLASILVFALILFLGVVGFKFLAPIVSEEIQQMSTGLQDRSAGDVMQKMQDRLGDDIPLLSNPMVQKELRMKVDAMLKKSFTIVVDLLSAVVSIIMLAFITFFFLKDGRRMKKKIVSWVPNRYFEMALIILHKISTQLGRYIRGQLLVALIVGSLSILALSLLHIRYAFFIGALAGLANMIPYFGPIVGAVPALVIALIDTGSLGAVVTVVVAFASIQLFENVFVSPFVVSKSVELHPLTIIIVILIGAQLMGVFGMLLAVPTASIIKVTARELAWGFKHYRIL